MDRRMGPVSQTAKAQIGMVAGRRVKLKRAGESPKVQSRKLPLGQAFLC